MAQRGDKSAKGEKNGFFRKMYSSIGNSSRQLAVHRQEKGQRSDSTTGSGGGLGHGNSSSNSSGHSSFQPSHNSPSDGATTTSGHRGSSSSSSSSTALQHFVKHHSFNGHMPFTRDEAQQRSAAGDSHQSMLSKRPSLIVPFSTQQQQMGLGVAAAGTAGGTADGSKTYLDDFQAPISKSGVLIKQANHFKTWKKRLMVLKGHSLFYYVSGTVREWRLRVTRDVRHWAYCSGHDGVLLL